MYRHFVPLLLLVAIFMGGFLFLTNTTWFVNRYGAQWLEHNVPDLTVSSLHVEQQAFRWPNRLRFKNLVGQFQYKGRDIELKAEYLYLRGSMKLSQNPDPLSVKLMGGDLTAQPLRLSGFQLDLNIPQKAFREKILEAKGALAAEKFRVQSIHMESLKIRFGLWPDQLQVVDLSASLYGGKVQNGQLSFQIRPDVPYIFWFEFEGLDAVRLEKLSPVIFSGLTGKVNGTCRLVGNASKVEVLAVPLTMEEGGQMSPALLTRFLPYVRMQDARTHIQQLIQQKQSLVFQKATLHIQNADPETVVLIVGIQNKSKDFQIQERISVPVKEGLGDLLLGDSELDPAGQARGGSFPR